MPLHFAHQLGNDQLYVANVNPKLSVPGTLFEGARAWFYSIAGGSGSSFFLPSLFKLLLMVSDGFRF